MCKNFIKKVFPLSLIVMIIFGVTFFSSCGKGGFYSSKTMVCLGDSITSGYMVKTAYPEKVKQILGLKNAYNYGIPGSTLTKSGGVFPFVERYRDMRDADVVAVLFAGNDASYDVPLGDIDDFDEDTIYGALNSLVVGLKEKYSNSYIFFITPFLNQGSKIYIEPCVNATRNICFKYNIDLLDQYAEDIEYNAERDTVDGCHLNQDYTNKVFAPRVANFIKEHFNKGNNE